MSDPENKPAEMSATAGVGERGQCHNCGCDLGIITEPLPKDRWWACEDCSRDLGDDEDD